MQRHTPALPWAIALTLAFLMMPVVPALAEEEPPQPTIVQHWVVWPKAGHEAEFEEAMKDFIAWRKAQGEGFSWNASAPVVGEDLTYYVFRAGPFFWKDLDGQSEWAQKVGVVSQWRDKVAAHVDHLEHYLVQLDPENSLWYESDDYRYWGVSLLKMKPGIYNTMISALKQIHKVAKEKEWKPGWSLQWTIGGSGADLVFVNPYRSYAEMADPETPFDKLLAEALGSEQGAQELMTQFWSCFEGGEYLIAEEVPELSTPE
jgi:hypothetical protein